ncbi:hypothetical protein EHQ71_18095 [Leptospira levettii]|uniref:coiled-coil domain-containing protein n=1 Tax=Leptospira levettii TaxID=2023178 RepID=UPI001083B1A4|nr:hypothetical protein [Leptospira levettii]TGM26220.1 hypothetical protein EHQ71_18095 [Leptospira levettii]
MKKELNSQEIYSRITNKVNNIHQIIGRIFAEPGISIDTINEVSVIQSEINSLSQELHNIWNQIHQKNLQDKKSNEFSEIESRIDTLKTEIDEKYKVSITEREETKQIRRIVELDKSEFEKAKKYHRNLSFVSLGILIGILILGYFGVKELYIDSIENLKFEDVKNIEEKYLFSYIFSKLTGKISILIGLAWLIKFLGQLHNKHSHQFVIYQDRLSGLNTAQFILSSGNSEVRERVIYQMVETYLSLHENAFKAQINPKNVQNFKMTDLKKITENIKDIVK